MKKLLFFVLLLGVGRFSLCQNRTTMGTDFWVSFLYFTYQYTAPQYTVTLHALVSAPHTCSVTMSNPNTSWSHTFNVMAGQVQYVDIPYTSGCTELSGQIANTAIHVTSTDTISLYLVNLGHYSIDITNALPTVSLGSEYMVQAYPSKLSADYRSEVVIVATEDSTMIDIVPSANTLNGFSAGSTYTITLQQGNAYQLRGASSPGEADLTGSRITARDCKKIAVFSGHFCAYVPTSQSTCDHIFDQSYPTAYWGSRFAVAGTGTAFADHVRVMALEDGCEVYKEGLLMATLNSGQVYDFTLTSSNRTAYIETSSPASVYMFLGSSGNSNGDPSMIIVNPVDQVVKDITFATYSTTYTNTHYVTIVAETDEMQQVRLDNNPVTSQPFSGNAAYRYARVQIPAGSHRLRTLGPKGFAAYAFGIGSHESYGYSVGSSLRVVGQSRLYANGVQVESGDTIVLCAGSDAIFHVSTDSGIVSGEWLIDNVMAGQCDTLHHQFPDTGWYRLNVHSSVIQYFECFNAALTNNEMELIVRVEPHYVVHYAETVNASQLPWYFMGNTYDEAVTDDTIYTTSIWGCDSVIIYTLMVNDRVHVNVYDTVCAGYPYHGYGFDLSAEETDSVGVCQYSYSDDTMITTLNLMQLAPPQVRLDYTLIGDSCYHLVCYTDADNVRWSSIPDDPSLAGQENATTVTVCPSVPTTYSVEAFYTGFPECAQTRSTSLSPRRNAWEKAELWVPNVFTPQLSTNNIFKAYGTGIGEFEMYVFQRWGMMIFHSTDIEEGWDGTYKNELCMSGTYAYLILYRSIYSPAELCRLAGTVTLIR